MLGGGFAPARTCYLAAQLADPTAYLPLYKLALLTYAEGDRPAARGWLVRGLVVDSAWRMGQDLLAAWVAEEEGERG